MASGFAELSEVFLSEVLSRKQKQSVRVRAVHVDDYLGRADLRKVKVEHPEGSAHLIVKVLPQNRRREALVWRFLDQAGAMPLPKVYHVEFDQRLGSYGVITEFLAPLGETEAWEAPQVQRVGRALAALHAAFWARTDGLPEPFAAPETPAEAAVEPAARRFVDGLSPGRQERLYADVPDALMLLVKLLRMPPSFFAEATDIPSTLIHGRLRRSEVLFRPHGAGPQPVFIDWYEARIGRGTEDLASLANSVPAGERPAATEGLLAGYLEGLKAAEVVFDLERIREELDRQRVLLGCHHLPGRCTQYIERYRDPEQRASCPALAGEIVADAAEWRRLLKQQSRKARHAPVEEPEDIT